MLSGNRLTTVGDPRGDPTPSAAPEAQGTTGGVCWGSLKSLLLGGNQMETWEAVDMLNWFPALVDLRITGNPLHAPGCVFRGLTYKLPFAIWPSIGRERIFSEKGSGPIWNRIFAVGTLEESMSK